MGARRDDGGGRGGLHRLAIAAPLQGRDRAATTAAIGRLRAGLDEVGAEPEESTAMLLRQAEAWLGRRPAGAAVT